LSLQAEVHEHKKTISLSSELAAELHIQECSSEAVEEFVESFDSDVVIVVSTFEEPEQFMRNLALLRQTLVRRGLRVPVVVARSKSDRPLSLANASDLRRQLAYCRIPFVSTSAFLGVNCDKVFTVAARLAIATQPARRKEKTEAKK